MIQHAAVVVDTTIRGLWSASPTSRGPLVLVLDNGLGPRLMSTVAAATILFALDKLWVAQ